MAVFSSPKAYIKINNQIAGFVRNLTFQETLNRVDVQGLGSLPLQEVPIVGYRCTWTVDQFFISFKAPVIEGMIHRLGTVQEILNTLIFSEYGFAIMIYTKTMTGYDSARQMVTQVDPTGETIAMLNPCFVNNQSFNISEAGVAGINVSGMYLNPITTAES